MFLMSSATKGIESCPWDEPPPVKMLQLSETWDGIGLVHISFLRCLLEMDYHETFRRSSHSHVSEMKVSIFQLRLISSNPHEFHHNTKQKFNPQKWHLTPPQNVSPLPGRLLALALRESFVVPLPLAVQNSVGELEIIRKIVGGWNFTFQIHTLKLT